ncbi:MAG: hypothetical protein ACU0B7_00715 [Paracoccaceae bacterium]
MASSDKLPEPSFSVALLTFVLQRHHIIILEDWIDFMKGAVVELVVHLGEDKEIEVGLKKLCEIRGIRLVNLGTVTVFEATENERELMQSQFDLVSTERACIVRLDTLPFCIEGVDWLADAIKIQFQSDAVFITGSTLPFRNDRIIASKKFRLTQRISNCFLIIDVDFWRKFQQGRIDSDKKYGRFAVEGAVEDFLEDNNLWGLRLLNSNDVRVFHCQEWGPRLIYVREQFRRGRALHPFLEGFQDDYMGADARYYMQPNSSFLRKIRISFGAWRRSLFS